MWQVASLMSQEILKRGRKWILQSCRVAGMSWDWWIPCCPSLCIWISTNLQSPSASVKVRFLLYLNRKWEKSKLKIHFSSYWTCSDKFRYFISQPGDHADAVIPWEKMRIVLDHGEDGAEDQTVRDVPLSYIIMVSRRSFGRKRLRLDYKNDGSWTASASWPTVCLNKEHFYWAQMKKRLDRISSFELHLCGENQIQRVDANDVICWTI